MPLGKAVIGQSGGPTAVINKSLIGFIKEALNEDFDEILGARHGIGGMLNQDFVDLSKPVSYTHLRAHETVLDLVCRLLLEKKKK